MFGTWSFLVQLTDMAIDWTEKQLKCVLTFFMLITVYLSVTYHSNVHGISVSCEVDFEVLNI